MKILLTLCLSLLPLTGWSQIPFPGQDQLKEIIDSIPKDDQYFQKIIAGSNQFGFNFYQRLKSRQGDLLFSPFDLSSGLAMVALGANGETASEIVNVLNYSVNLSPLISDLEHYLTKQKLLAIGNSIWIQEGIPITLLFKNAYKKNFGLDLVQVDFSKNPMQTAREINQWTSTQTRGKISQILNPGDVGKQTHFLLTTSFYFQKEWQIEFDRRKIVKAPFHYKGHPFQVEMMNHIGNYSYLKNEQFELLEIPFVDGLAMTIFLPQEGISLDQLEKGLNDTHFSEWIGQMKSSVIEIFLPKFRIDGRYELNSFLQGMGIKQAFGSHADFSELSSEQGLFLNKAIHKTFIRVEEKGKEIMKDLPLEKKAPVVKVDRPFFFIVRDRETNLILQMGRLTQP